MADRTKNKSKNKNVIITQPPLPSKQTSSDDWKKRIEPLIEKVDMTCLPQLFTRERKYIVIFVSFICIAFFVGIQLTYSSYYSLFSEYNKLLSLLLNDTATFDPYSHLAIMTQQSSFFTSFLITIVAMDITLIALWLSYVLKPSSKKEIADSYYRKHALEVEYEDRTYFKALINMKCKEMTLKLSRTYKLNPEMFSQEALLKRLYD